VPSSLAHEIGLLEALLGGSRDPDGRAFAPLADAHRRSGDLDRALQILTDGLARHPGFATAHLVAGWVHRDRGQGTAAELAFRRVLELDPENVSALRGLAEGAEAAGDPEGALAYFHRLAVLQPGDAEVEERIERLDRTGELAGGGASVLLPDPFVSADDGFAARGERAVPAPDPAWFGPPSAQVEEEPPEAEELDGEAEVYTRTMAELYLAQGFTQRAVTVLEHLVQADPQDEGLLRRLQEIRGDAAGAGLPEEDRWEGIPTDPPDGTMEGAEDPEAVPAEFPAEVDGELLAAAGYGADPLRPEVTTPFAWPGPVGGKEERGAGIAIGAYFRDLLQWTPGPPSVPVESLAPDASVPWAPVESLAPDGEPAWVPVESLRPAAEVGWLPVRELEAPPEPVPAPPRAPDEEPQVLPVDELAPHEEPRVVPVEALAPHEEPRVVPADELAPDAEAEATLLDESAAGLDSEPGPDGEVGPGTPSLGEGPVPPVPGSADEDEFRVWLDRFRP